MKPVTLRPFSMLTGDDLATATERAAIREFDGGQPRAEAERKARMAKLNRVLNQNSDLKGK